MKVEAFPALGQKNYIYVFTVCRPTLIFGLDPKLFYGTFTLFFSNVVFDVKGIIIMTKTS